MRVNLTRGKEKGNKSPDKAQTTPKWGLCSQAERSSVEHPPALLGAASVPLVVPEISHSPLLGASSRTSCSALPPNREQQTNSSEPGRFSWAAVRDAAPWGGSCGDPAGPRGLGWWV